MEIKEVEVIPARGIGNDIRVEVELVDGIEVRLIMDFEGTQYNGYTAFVGDEVYNHIMLDEEETEIVDYLKKNVLKKEKE